MCSYKLNLHLLNHRYFMENYKYLAISHILLLLHSLPDSGEIILCKLLYVFCLVVWGFWKFYLRQTLKFFFSQITLKLEKNREKLNTKDLRLHFEVCTEIFEGGKKDTSCSLKRNLKKKFTSTDWTQFVCLFVFLFAALQRHSQGLTA